MIFDVESVKSTKTFDFYHFLIGMLPKKTLVFSIFLLSIVMARDRNLSAAVHHPHFPLLYSASHNF